MKDRASLLAAGVVLLAAVALVAALLLTLADPRPVARDWADHGGEVHLSADRTLVLFPTDCLMATWRTESIQAVFLNRQPTVGAGAERVCGEDPSLRIVFAGGDEVTYRIERTVLFPALPRAALIALAALVAVWYALARARRVPLAPGHAGEQVARFVDRALFVSGSNLPSPTRGEEPGARASDRSTALLRAALLLLLFGYGLLQWAQFYNGGTLTGTAHDWELNMSYRAVVQQALATGQVPYLVDDGDGKTIRFLGVPEVPLAPHAFLLSHLPPGHYALAETLLFYTLGFAGLLLIRWRYRVSLAVFAVLFLLFNFNGHIVAHLAVGHVPWNAYFLLPFAVLFILRMVEADRALRSAVLLALVLLLIELQGGFHMALWCVFTLVILGVFNPGLRVPVAVAVVGGLGLAAWRFIPAALSFATYDEVFRTGYPTVQHLLDALTAVRPPDYAGTLDSSLQSTLFTRLGWWEFDLYIGVLGIAFLAVFGIAARFWRDPRPDARLNPNLDALRYRALDLPIVAMSVLAFSVFYRPIATLPLPLVNSERVTTRFLLLPFVLLLVLASLRADRLLPILLTGWKRKLVVVAAILQLAVALNLHLQVWNVLDIERDAAPLEPPPAVAILDLNPFNATGADRLYVTSIPLAVLLSVLVAVGLLALYVRDVVRPSRTRDNPPSNSPVNPTLDNPAPPPQETP